MTLINQIGNILTGNVMYGQRPENPDNIVLLNRTGGLAPTRSLGLVLPTKRYQSFQMLVRNKSYEEGIDILENNRKIIMSTYGKLGKYYVLKINQSSDIFDWGRDDSNRYIFTINFTVHTDELKEE